MEKGLLDSVLSLYHVATNKSTGYEKIREQFSNVSIDACLIHTSGISGKVPMNRHLLEKDIQEKTVEEILSLI